VYKTVADNWRQIRGRQENQDWVRDVRIPQFSNYYFVHSKYTYRYRVGLYDDYGDRVAVFNSELSISFNRYDEEITVIAQHRYYDNTRFQEIQFTVPLDDVTDNMTPRIDQIVITPDEYIGPRTAAAFPSMTVAEWREWLSQNNSTNQANVPASSNSFSVSGNNSSNTPSANTVPANTAESRATANKSAIENLLREFGPNMFSSGRFQLGNSIPTDTITNAMTSYALVRSRNDFIAVLDDAILARNRGKTGFAFTAEGIYFSWFGATGYIRYADFERLEVIRETPPRDPI
jgi:hypothetical protein